MYTRTMLLVLATAAGSARASDVYQNTTSPVGTFDALLASGGADSLERGNQINLGGLDRTASRFTWLLRPPQNGTATFDVRLRFYANDGPGGQPGSILWDSGPVHMFTDSGPDMALTLLMPPITLPNTLTWTVQASNRTGVSGAAGPAHYHPPAIGSAPFGYWERSAQGQWSYTGQAEPPFVARLVATSCYANCDTSTTPPILNVLDFGCFLNKFAAGDPYANCDGSITPPVLNVLDFSCFLNKFAAGCS